MNFSGVSKASQAYTEFIEKKTWGLLNHILREENSMAFSLMSNERNVVHSIFPPKLHLKPVPLPLNCMHESSPLSGHKTQVLFALFHKQSLIQLLHVADSYKLEQKNYYKRDCILVLCILQKGLYIGIVYQNKH